MQLRSQIKKKLFFVKVAKFPTIIISTKVDMPEQHISYLKIALLIDNTSGQFTKTFFGVIYAAAGILLP